MSDARHKARPFLRRLAGDCRGVAAIEFAICAPILLVVMFGIIELGRIMWTQNALHYSVEEAARCMTIDTTVCSSSSTTQSFAAARSGVPNIPTSAFTVANAGCGNQVSASYLFPFISNEFNISITLSASSCFPA
jgi:Flp pilus assembly protein TadG